MNPNCKQVIENLSLHRNPDLTHSEEVERKKHRVECPVCQKAYDQMLHTAAVLENLPLPLPPPDLVGCIQAQIRQEYRHSHRISLPIQLLLTIS